MILLKIQAPDPDDPCVNHCCADHADRLDRHLAIGVEVIWAVEVDRVDFAAGDKHLQVDDLRALQIERLQLGGRKLSTPACLAPPATCSTFNRNHQQERRFSGLSVGATRTHRRLIHTALAGLAESEDDRTPALATVLTSGWTLHSGRFGIEAKYSAPNRSIVIFRYLQILT